MEKELKDKIKIEEDDLKNFFLANKKKYQEKQKAKISLIKSGMLEAAEKLSEKIKAGEDFSELAERYSLDKESAENGGKWKGWVVDGEDSLGIGYVDEVSKAIFSLKKGEVSDPVEIGKYFYIFRMDDYKPARDREFEEVKEQVARDYYASKLKKAYQALLDQVLKTEEVKLYPEVILETKK
jgi:parvulin-like peptidyl-prolyl isomerase